MKKSGEESYKAGITLIIVAFLGFVLLTPNGMEAQTIRQNNSEGCSIIHEGDNVYRNMLDLLQQSGLPPTVYSLQHQKNPPDVGWILIPPGGDPQSLTTPEALKRDRVLTGTELCLRK